MWQPSAFLKKLAVAHSLSLSLVFPQYLWSSYPSGKCFFYLSVSARWPPHCRDRFSLPLTPQSHLPQHLPFLPSADNPVSYFIKMGRNKKRTSWFSIHLTVSLPVFSALPATLPNKLYILLSCELVLARFTHWMTSLFNSLLSLLELINMPWTIQLSFSSVWTTPFVHPFLQ